MRKRYWTFYLLDYDDSDQNTTPTLLWNTEEEAKAAAERWWAEMYEEDPGQYLESLGPELDWQLVYGELRARPWPSAELIVYPMEVQDAGA